MRKFLFSIAIASLLISCGKSIESDAKKIADLTCKAQENKSNPIENLKFVEEIEKIEKKYSGDEKEKLEKLATELYLKQCGDKISSGFFDSESSDEKISQESSNISNSNNLSIDETIVSTGSSNYDKMLDNYEEYVDEYIKFYKKAQTGDETALMEYSEMMEKANNLQQSMEKAQNDNELSSDQVARMMRIQAKMVEGMQ